MKVWAGRASDGLALLPANVVFGFLYSKHHHLAFGVSATLAALGAAVLITTGDVEEVTA